MFLHIPGEKIPGSVVADTGQQNKEEALMKKVLSIIMILVLMFSVSVPVYAADPVEITIFHFNDTHSRVEGSSWTGNMGFAKMATFVEEARTAGDNVLLLDAGDSFHGQTIATISEGASIAQLLNLMKVDAMAAGNHDFNYGQDRLLELQTETDFPIMGANVLKDETAILDEYVIKEFDGVKVAIFGLSTPETSYKTHPANVAGLVFEDPAVTAQRMVDTLTPMADVIIALGHIGEEGDYTSKAICEAVDGIDIFVDGHSHTIINEVVNDTLLVQTGEYDKNLGKIALTYDNGTITAAASLITNDDAADVAEEADVVALIDEIKADNDVITSVVVGNTDIELNGERAYVRTGETNLGNLIAEAMLAETGADVAVTNGGGIRASIEVGEITQGDVITVLPFGNYVVTKDVIGADIRAILEVGISDYPDAKGAFPHIAGMTIEFDPNMPTGSKLTKVMIGNEMMNDAKIYTLATNDFLAAGGDDYVVLADDVIKNEYDALDEVLVTFLNAEGTAKAAVTGRISVFEAETYTVNAGDVLWKIAKSFGLTWEEVSEYNMLENPHLIFPGDVLNIPAN